jgi:hypothetical protein
VFLARRSGLSSRSPESFAGAAWPPFSGVTGLLQAKPPARHRGRRQAAGEHECSQMLFHDAPPVELSIFRQDSAFLMAPLFERHDLLSVPRDGVEIGISPPTQSPRTRASGNNILILPERKRLQSKARYIDARPQVRQLEEVLLQRTAGPYIGVKLDRAGQGNKSIYVRYAPP